ncbi:MAG: cyclase family protein [Candidatus Limnocylindria bacterium]
MCIDATAHGSHSRPTAVTTAPIHGRADGGLDRRGFLKAAALAGTGAAVASALPLSLVQAAAGQVRPRFADLTHVFRAGSPVYTFANPTRETLVTIPANGFYAQQWTFAEHSGTHLDAPGHFVAGNRLADELPPDELVAPIVVIDISARAAVDPDAEVTPDDLRVFERRHGRIPRGSIVAMYSGWEVRIGDQQAYRNPDAGGTFHFPGFGIDAAQWLLAERDIRGIGVDTLSQDNGPSTSFAVHFAVLGAERYGLENLRNLATIPPRGATAFVGLVPWEEGSGGPARVIANW